MICCDDDVVLMGGKIEFLLLISGVYFDWICVAFVIGNAPLGLRCDFRLFYLP
jgi:hypothetical protein